MGFELATPGLPNCGDIPSISFVQETNASSDTKSAINGQNQGKENKKLCRIYEWRQIMKHKSID